MVRYILRSSKGKNLLTSVEGVERVILVVGLKISGDMVWVLVAASKLIVLLHICKRSRDAIIGLLRLRKYLLGMV